MSAIASEKGEAPYHKLFEAVCRRTDISQSAKLLHAVIQSLSRAGGFCFASDATLGEMIGVAARQAKRAIAELAELKLILVLGTAKRRRLRPISVKNDQNEQAIDDENLSEKTRFRSEMSKSQAKNGQKCQEKTVKNDYITDSGEQTSIEQTTTDSAASLTEEGLVVVGELCSFGISSTAAVALVQEYGAGKCLRAVSEAKAKCGAIKNPAVWICKCIAENWSVGKPPREWKMTSPDEVNAVIAAYGHEAVLMEMERRQRESAAAGDAQRAARRLLILEAMKQGATAGEAFARAAARNEATA